MKRIGVIADYRHDTGAGPQVAKLLRHEGLPVVEIQRGLDLSDGVHRARVSSLFASVDCLYSIGRNKQANAYMALADGGLPHINHWIGTEVLDLLQGVGSPEEKQRIQGIDVHLACAPWIAEELKQLAIEARVVPIVSFDRKTTLDDPPPGHAVLTYLLQGRAQFYGVDAVSVAADTFPHIPFYIVGNDGRGETARDNLVYLGWLSGDEMEELYRKCSILLRCPRHDGLSMMVVEALGKGKEVIYNHPYPHCRLARSTAEVICLLHKITESQPKANVEGHRFVNDNLSKRVVGAQMRTVLESL